MPTSSKNNASDIFITGMGLVLPCGRGVDSLYALAQEKKHYLADGLGRLPEREAPCPLTQVAVPAARDALREAGWGTLQSSSDGLILATTTGHSVRWEAPLQDFVRKEADAAQFLPAFRSLPLGSFLEDLARELNFTGRRQLVSTACAAGVHALSLACLWLRAGLVKRVLVGGVETLCQLTVGGFSSLQLLSKNPCKPFDAMRTGINLAEGGAFLTLELHPTVVPSAKISGHGFAQDAYHMTSPHPEGRGSVQAMRQALERSGLTPADIDWVHAHGTGSPHNDSAEGQAIQQLFGSALPPVTSTKGTHGHLLGATGIVETALVAEALRREEMLPTTGFETLDPRLSLPILERTRKSAIRHVLKNVLGFGGSNGALVVSRV